LRDRDARDGQRLRLQPFHRPLPLPPRALHPPRARRRRLRRLHGPGAAPAEALLPGGNRHAPRFREEGVRGPAHGARGRRVGHQAGTLLACGRAVLRRRRRLGSRAGLERLEERRRARTALARGDRRFRARGRGRALQPRAREAHRQVEPPRPDPLLTGFVVTSPILLALGLPVASAATPAAAGEPPLPEGNAYVQGLVAKQKEREEAVNRYTYDVEELLEEQDAKGVTTSRHVRRYEVFHVKGRAVRKLVAEGGTPLGRAVREEEEARVRREVEDILKGKAAAEDPSLQLSTILARYDFKTVGRQDQDGWPTLVLDWSARPGKRDIEGDAVLRNLAGRLFVD